MPSTDPLRTTVLLVSNSTGQTGRVEIMDLSGRGNEWLGSGVLEYPISMQKAVTLASMCSPHGASPLTWWPLTCPLVLRLWPLALHQSYHMPYLLPLGISSWNLQWSHTWVFLLPLQQLLLEPLGIEAPSPWPSYFWGPKGRNFF